MLTDKFLSEFKRATEARWSILALDPRIFGFQFQPGTRWLQGLSEEQLSAYERELGARFPDDFRSFLRKVNGTDLPTRNIYGSDGTPAREGVGVYSFPRDLALVRRLTRDIDGRRAEIASTLALQGSELAADAKLVPIYGDRYVVCSANPTQSVVLSIVVDAVDAVVYGDSLQEYLEREFLGRQ
jgi:hypothetical protein